MGRIESSIWLRDMAIVVMSSFVVTTCVADEVSYSYEGDVLPYEDAGGWVIFNPCEAPCSESVQNARFVLEWPQAGDLAYYTYVIASEPVDRPPATLWVEWRFRSNHPIGPNFYTCDAWFTVDYRAIHEPVFMYGDAVVSFSGGDAVVGLDIDKFHTYRFESLDGMNYWMSVDGVVFILDTDDNWDGSSYLQFSGRGGCGIDQIPDMVNEWDMVRYGTISYGEKIVAVDPPSGYLDADQYPALDRFAVTFDSPNYVYVDDITIEVSGGSAPVVTQTWRRENDGPETLEIVLDKPIPLGQHTRFVIDDGVALNIVDYSYILGDGDGNGAVDLTDFALLHECVANGEPDTGTGRTCRFADVDGDNDTDLYDFALFQIAFSGDGS